MLNLFQHLMLLDPDPDLSGRGDVRSKLGHYRIVAKGNFGEYFLNYL